MSDTQYQNEGINRVRPLEINVTSAGVIKNIIERSEQILWFLTVSSGSWVATIDPNMIGRRYFVTDIK